MTAEGIRNIKINFPGVPQHPGDVAAYYQFVTLQLLQEIAAQLAEIREEIRKE